MSNLRLIVVNQGDIATLSASPAVAANLPVSNLQLAPRARAMRTTGVADQKVLGDLASGQVADGFSLARHNLSSVATVKLRLFDAAGQTGTLVYDSGDVKVSEPIAAGVFRAGVDPWGDNESDYDVIFTHWFSAVAYRSFEITIKDPLNPDGYFQVGRMFLGLSLSPSVNYAYGAKLAWVEDTKQERTAGGSLRSEGSEGYRRFDIDLNHLNKADREVFASAFRRVGKRQDILIAGYPEEPGALAVDYTLVAKLTAGNSYTAASFERFTAQYSFEEA